MRNEWTELRAPLLVAPHMDMLMTFVGAQDYPGSLSDYGDIPFESKCAIGYMSCLMLVDVTGGKIDPSEHFRHPGTFRETIAPLFPVRYYGFGGERGEVGPAYLVAECCMEGVRSRLFYSDTDIAGDWDKATELAECIRHASSGIAGVRVEQLTCVRSIMTELSGERWCVTFSLDDRTHKTVSVEGVDVTCEGLFGLLVLPKDLDHEYRCMVGEIQSNDPDNAFMLAWHTFHAC